MKTVTTLISSTQLGCEFITLEMPKNRAMKMTLYPRLKIRERPESHSPIPEVGSVWTLRLSEEEREAYFEHYSETFFPRQVVYVGDGEFKWK